MIGRLAALTRLVADDPLVGAYHIWARVSPGLLRRRYAENGRRAGLDRLHLILSFDCDTDDDIAVVWDVHSRLTDMGVRPVYAVPGALLQKGQRTYRRIADTGAEFINHGGVSHTYFDEAADRHASCFFYDELAADRVRQDVIEGDAIVKDVLGVSPRGFRTPHFGTYQKPAQLRFLHGVLRELGYRFSSSTGPFWALRNGPMFGDFGLLELPVTGAPSRPLSILDSWGYFAAPDRAFGPADYAREASALAALFATQGTGLINLYADPSHVAGNEVFFHAIARLAAVAPSAHFADVVP